MGQGTGQHNSCSKKKWTLIIGGALVLLIYLFNGHSFGPQERDSSELTNCQFPTSVATPVDWKHSNKCMMLPTLTDEALRIKFRTFEVVEVPSGKHCIGMIVSNTK